MRIYLAGSYHRRLELADYAVLLTNDLHEITSRWVTGLHELPNWTESSIALDDLKCIEEAECAIFFTEPADGSASMKRGGRHVEFGYAVALGKLIFVVGPRENVFYHLPEVNQFDTFDEVRADLPADL